MIVFDLLKTFVFLVSGVLLYPVLILLSLAAVYMVWALGRFLGEWMERAKAGGFDPDRDSVTAFAFSGAVRRYRDMLLVSDRSDEAAVMYRMREAVAERKKTLDIYRMMIRVAPALGLLGTLIPMGSALAGVGQGEMQLASSELVVAFTTTVVGLAVGSLAYVLHAVKSRWIAEDIRQIEFITEKVCR